MRRYVRATTAATSMMPAFAGAMDEPDSPEADFGLSRLLGRTGELSLAISGMLWP